VVALSKCGTVEMWLSSELRWSLFFADKVDAFSINALIQVCFNCAAVSRCSGK